MIPLELDVIEPLGKLIARPWADVVTGMQVDSRRIEEGDLFVAVGGGEDFVEHALARGAAAALVPADEFAALAAIAGAVRERSTARVVGITGSTGKTSTKDILYALCAPAPADDRERRQLQHRDRRAADDLPHRGGHRDLHQRARDARPRARSPGSRRSCRPDVGVITNIGPAHLELLETIENVARAKAELIDALPAGGVAVVPRRAAARAVPDAHRHRHQARRLDMRRCRSRRATPRSTSCRTRARRSRSPSASTCRLPDVAERRVLEAPRGGAAAARRRPAAERLLQREPRLDARGARALRRSRAGEPPAGRRSRRHGRARAGRGRLPSRGPGAGRSSSGSSA